MLDYATGARLVIRYSHDRGVIIDYAVVLVLPHDGAEQTIRVYDGAHDVNDMHRHTRSRGKASAERFHAVHSPKACGSPSTRSKPATAR
ncbi:hypothetical protein VSS74_13125 [Conexibacter stalactiti]|uniref:Transposase IS4-like domain-containing protein n=1 Tax=Conexibacter stalactiti TaxID=1940611 RepID=A0ABU4HPQ2_9ACTN|nr:hypothetical protein [Conexibacter stalactiti]MDW5595285.1 hypothetical protein [Conexibacter stalactiti]MEC5035927.1 hypothetical protein [Conexibacter stalactiti]